MAKKHLFRRLLKKAVSMALWTKASLCGKSSLLEQSLPRTPSRPKTSAISAFSAVKNSCLCAFCAFLWLKIRLIYAIRSTKDYVRKNKLFMQNKANFRKSQMNVNKVLTKDYEQMDTWSIRKNEPKTNPNEPKVKIGKMNATSYITKEYDKTGNSPRKNEPKTNPKQTQFYRGVASGEAEFHPAKNAAKCTIKEPGSTFLDRNQITLYHRPKINLEILL